MMTFSITHLITLANSLFFQNAKFHKNIFLLCGFIEKTAMRTWESQKPQGDILKSLNHPKQKRSNGEPMITFSQPEVTIGENIQAYLSITKHPFLVNSQAPCEDMFVYGPWTNVFEHASLLCKMQYQSISTLPTPGTYGGQQRTKQGLECTLPSPSDLLRYN